MSGEDTDIEWNIRIPLPVLSAGFHALEVASLWNDWEYNVVFCDGEIVDHGYYRRDEPYSLQEFSVSSYSVVTNIRSAIPFRLVAETDELASLWIEFRMGGESARRKLAIESFESDGF